MSGYISLHRKLLDWEWYNDNNTKVLFIHCLLKANWEDKNWQGILIKRGSFITSIETLSNELNLTFQNIRTSLSKLEKTNEIVKISTNKNTLLTLVKYDEYQNTEVKVTNEQQTNNKQLTTTNNINNINNKLLSEIEISDVEVSLQNYFIIAKNFQELFIRNLTEKSISTVTQKNAKFKNYVTPIRLMIENNECTLQDLRDVWSYLSSPKSEFWKKNILSTTKLREQIVKLIFETKKP